MTKKVSEVVGVEKSSDRKIPNEYIIYILTYTDILINDNACSCMDTYKTKTIDYI